MRALSLLLFRGPLLIAALAAVVASSRSTSADPNFTLDPASPSLALILANADDVLNPSTGSPSWGGQPPPAMVLPGALMGLPAVATMDDFSYGDEIPMGPLALAYSVNRAAVGFPIAGNALAAEAVGPEGAVGTDLFTTAGPLLPAPCGLPIGAATSLTDGDGMTAGAAPLRLGLGLDELPPFGFAGQDDVSGLELENWMGGPVYFTVDAPTALALGVSAADILAWFPGPPGWFVWAPAAALGLMLGDDIDALTVGDPTMPDMAFTPGADWVFFSLKPGSPSLGVLPHCLAWPPPNLANPGDVWLKFGPGGPPAAVVDAEMLGLATLRSGTVFVDDNLDALDFVTAFAPMDTDGDLADNAVDFDDDNDGLSDTPDAAAGCSPLVADTDGDGLTDYQEVMVTGTNCALADTDGDLCADSEELGANPVFGGQRNPTYSWDFFDVTLDASIDLSDALDILTFFGDAGLPSTPGDLRDRDNYSSAQPWQTYEVNDGVDLTDALVNLQSFGHDCSGSP